MIKNYFKIAWRNLVKNKMHSSINIVGLSVGMAVAMIIGLWIWDELSYEKANPHYDRIAQVMQNNTLNGEIGTWTSMPRPLGDELRKSYGSDFKYVLYIVLDRNAFPDLRRQKNHERRKFLRTPGSGYAGSENA